MAGDSNLFKQINNAVLDLQRSHIQSYERPLKSLANLLRHSDLEEINSKLTSGLDLEKFLQESAATQGGMVGSARLIWPEDKAEEIGLVLLLIEKFADNPRFMADFGHQFFYSGSKIIAGVHAVTSQVIIPFARDYKAYAMQSGNAAPRLMITNSKRVFIVHGHDVEARETVARFLLHIGLQPIILHEQANRGRTVIEKVEANSEVGFAIVLLTPDDEGSVKGGQLEPRARQNVVLELGYFLGKLGRDRVCALKRGQLEIPSDFAGVVWETMDDAGGWKQKLAKELQEVGYDIDWNKIMS